MTILSHRMYSTGSIGKYFGITVIETPYGMLLNEERLAKRIQDHECSYEFMVEIAESTLPFRNIHNLMLNLINYQTWTSEAMNLKCMMKQIMVSCEKVMQEDKPPCTRGCVGEDFVGRGQKEYPYTYEEIRKMTQNQIEKFQDGWADERHKRKGTITWTGQERQALQRQKKVSASCPANYPMMSKKRKNEIT